MNQGLQTDAKHVFLNTEYSWEKSLMSVSTKSRLNITGHETQSPPDPLQLCEPFVTAPGAGPAGCHCVAQDLQRRTGHSRAPLFPLP